MERHASPAVAWPEQDSNLVARVSHLTENCKMRDPENEIGQQKRSLSQYEHVVSSTVKVSVWLHAKLHANKIILQTRTAVQ